MFESRTGSYLYSSQQLLLQFLLREILSWGLGSDFGFSEQDIHCFVRNNTIIFVTSLALGHRAWTSSMSVDFFLLQPDKRDCWLMMRLFIVAALIMSQLWGTKVQATPPRMWKAVVTHTVATFIHLVVCKLQVSSDLLGQALSVVKQNNKDFIKVIFSHLQGFYLKQVSTVSVFFEN